MKTNIIHLAVTLFAVTAFAPSAFAGPKYTPRFNNGQKPAAASDCCVTKDPCKGVACCGKTYVSTPATGGRGAQANFKRVIACEKTCTVAKENQAAHCRKGAGA